MKKILFIIICIFLASCSPKTINKIDTNTINVIDDSDTLEFDFDINCKEYMLVRLSDFKVLYKHETSKQIYPASLTKLVTLDTVLNLENNLNNKSSLSYEQILDLIKEDASLAGLKADKEYTISELLYALILPSGADGALALENYFKNKDIDLVEQMNIQTDKLGCTSSNFVNTTGLHDDNHYTSLDDLFKVVMDILTFEKGREYLETMYYTVDENSILKSTVLPIKNSKVDVLGGKTGYTPESGQSIITVYRNHNRSYLLMIANADRNNFDELNHYKDCIEIFSRLY